jgi:predicted transposase YbfD/YdcC
VITSSGSKAIKAAFSTKPNACSPSRLSPPEAKASWVKEHGRLDRRRIARAAVTPEEIGLCGCWQVIAIERQSLDLTQPNDPPSLEVGFYATSLSLDQYDEAGLEEIIRGHWSAIENGTHYRRDVTLGEDANRTTDRKGAEALASLRNLANGIYELQRERKRTKVDTFKSWCQQQTFSTVWPILVS